MYWMIYIAMPYTLLNPFVTSGKLVFCSYSHLLLVPETLEPLWFLALAYGVLHHCQFILNSW